MLSKISEKAEEWMLEEYPHYKKTQPRYSDLHRAYMSGYLDAVKDSYKEEGSKDG